VGPETQKSNAVTSQNGMNLVKFKKEGEGITGNGTTNKLVCSRPRQRRVKGNLPVCGFSLQIRKMEDTKGEKEDAPIGPNFQPTPSTKVNVRQGRGER